RHPAAPARGAGRPVAEPLGPPSEVAIPRIAVAGDRACRRRAGRSSRPPASIPPHANANAPRPGTIAAYRTSGPPFAPRAHRDRRAREEAAMAAPTDPLTGDALLEAVNDAMIALHQRYYHRAPISARTQLLDDEILACVMGGVYTEVEKTLIEL